MIGTTLGRPDIPKEKTMQIEVAVPQGESLAGAVRRVGCALADAVPLMRHRVELKSVYRAAGECRFVYRVSPREWRI
jgi:hypothetical protein